MLVVTNKSFMLSVIMQSVIMLSAVMLSAIMLSVTMLSVVMLSVVMLSVAMLSFVAQLTPNNRKKIEGLILCLLLSTHKGC